MELVRHHIDGQAHQAAAARVGQVFDPARGAVAREVAFANEAEVDLAVASATAAFPLWRDTPVTRRQKVLFAYRELVERHRDDLAKLVVAEHGKTLDDARGEVSRGLEVIEFACGIPHLLKGSYSENVSTNVDTYTIRQPLGVVAGITPFNFPVMVPLWMFPMAIAAGNAFILKPSEKDPSPSVLAAELFRDAGLPPGILNVVHGDREAVERLVTHPDVSAISFVGSTPVARHVYQQGTAHGKRVQALAGAKNHMLVLPDADMGLAADSAVSAGYGSAGERCMAISVVVTVGDAADRLIPEISARIAKLKIGAGIEPESEMGPLITGEHRDRVRRYIDSGVAAGATVVADGRTFQRHQAGGGNGSNGASDAGFFLGATLFDHVTIDMEIYRDEIFGPVLSVVRVEDFAAAIELINSNPWGNGTAIFTNDGGAARTFQNEIQVGMVGINLPIPVPLGFYSFGGWKQSIFGDHAIYGPESINFYTRPKVMISRWPDPIHRGVELGFRPGTR
jgi:malonate-semialdehyde dehydrogenase (acetylating)/methylmalonate-semialdehyde dehydrogenase